jgi:hypothetical protein
MNTCKRRASYKLTLVSIWFRGRRSSFFVSLPLVNGQPQLSSEILEQELAGVPRGCTYSIGA